MPYDERYLIGVPHLDAQHRALFSAIGRIKGVVLEHDDDRNKRLFVEAIKFFEDHVSRHFADEEAYMRSIQFSRYEQHKTQHEAIVETLNDLKKDIIESDYAPWSLKQLVGTLMAWLSYHTVEIDSAIGKPAPRIDCSNDAAVAMEYAITRMTSEVLHSDLFLMDGNCGEYPYGEAAYCVVDCSHLDGRRFRVMTAISEQVVIQTAAILFSSKPAEVDETALSAVKELCALLTIHFVRNYQNGEFFHLDQVSHPDKSQFTAEQPQQDPLCSLLFSTMSGFLWVRAWNTTGAQ